ncbi:MAG: phosphoribosylformylglycinamidine synthase, partial [Clostridia bacterium]|nr:phosphoribosylformylglycinamidine synthase [Clostridia bacterium]
FLTELGDIKVEDGGYEKEIRKGIARYLAARAEVYGDDTTRPVTLMDMGTIGAKVLKKRGLIPDLDESDEINACSIEVPVEIDGRTEQWLVQFKNETHNHPTEIEPFGGAATCLGGAIRDPLSGRAYVYQAMRVTGAADPRVPVSETMENKLPQRKITTGAAAGYSSYGNQIGLATGQVTEIYDYGYTAKRLEIGAVVGASPKKNVVRGVPEPGDVVVLLGGRTGRDGCGGATGSSKAHDSTSLESCGAEVQKGNPPTERKIQRLFRNGKVAAMIKRCNDFGAGGVCVAIGELADGLDIRLDDVRKKYEGLDGTELAISESQERMAVVLDKSDVRKFIAEAEKENLEAYEVAVVSEDPRLTMVWRGKTIVSLSREFLNTNGVRQHASAKIKAVYPYNDYRVSVPYELRGLPVTEALVKNMGRLNVCCQKGLSERFDASIGAATVLMPFAGKNQLTPEEAMVAKLPVDRGETDCATAMAFGYVPGHTEWSPYHGSAFAVVESLSRLLAVGANPLEARLTFQEYFERLGERPSRWGKPAAALLGALTAQLKLGTPSIGGKDSMSGSFNDLDVPPTLVSFALAMTSAKRTLSAAFTKSNSTVVLVPVPYHKKRSHMPKWKKLRQMYECVYHMICSGDVLSASVVHEGGASASVIKACFGNGLGFAFDESVTDTELFAPLSGSLVLELRDGAHMLSGMKYTVLGKTTANPLVRIGMSKVALGKLRDAWMTPLEPIFPVSPKERPVVKNVPMNTSRARYPSIMPKLDAKPRVFIPVFPGTNCELDTARQFEKAGARSDILVVKNLTPAAIEETIREMARRIAKAQIVMLPGGFSGGDEPDGSGKFIATTFRNPLIAEQVTKLLEERDGLMLGICNGFQALIKLGLVPYGRITDIGQNDPTLTFNTLGRHVSRMVYTRVTSVKSPWLHECEVGEMHTVPVSHGEGRFVADDEMLGKLIANGQVATQYVDPNGMPSSDIEWNPNGSVCAIEGITSPDGRVFGKMGHSERMGTNLYKNVPGEKDQKIFLSGVKYFK